MAKKKFERTKRTSTSAHRPHRHGKTTLTAAITKYLALKGGAEFRAFGLDRQRPEERERGYHDRDRPRRVRDDKATTPTSTAPSRRLHQEHDTEPPRWTARSSLVPRPRPMPQTREHILLARQWKSLHVVFLNKCDAGRRSRAASSVELEVGAADQEPLPRRRSSRSSAAPP